MDRRQFLTASAAAGLAALPQERAFAQGMGAGNWNTGDVTHLRQQFLVPGPPVEIPGHGHQMTGATIGGGRQPAGMGPRRRGR